MDGHGGSARRTRADVVGRDVERRAVENLFDPDSDRRAVVLDGDAGIGKSTVFLAAIDFAERSGYRVLRCQPAESESSLPFVALGDLLDPVLGDTLPSLPEPQREALEVALLRVQPAQSHARLAVSRAVLAILRELAGRGPLAIAIDDVQWLDPASAEVIEFAVRRLAETQVRFLVARRSHRDHPPPLGLDRALDNGRVESRRVGPLPVGDLDRLLRINLDLQLARPRLIELHRRAEGNPFYALEIARVAPRAEADDWRIPDSLGALLRDRLAALPPSARQVIQLVAASAQPTTDLVERAVESDEGLTEAIRGDVLVLDGRRIRFTHPLLASVSYESATPAERRATHGRLAEAVQDAEERGRHLALATIRPDAAIAAELDLATTLAAARGAPESAASLATHAARLTPPTDAADGRRRLADAAEHHIESGDPLRGRRLLRELVDQLDAGPERANLLWRLADAGGMSLQESIRLAEQALTEAGDDPATRAEIEIALGVFTWITGDLARSAEHTRQAAAFAELAGDELLVAMSLGEVSHIDVVLGKPLDEREMDRALEIERRVGSIGPYLRPSFQLGILRMYTDDLAAARPLLEEAFRQIDTAGDESARCGMLFRLAELELRFGAWAKAATYARDAMASAMQAAIEQEQSVGLMIHAQVQAHIGNLDDARDTANAALAMTATTNDRVVALRTMGVLGFIELSRGDPAAALRWLSPALDELRALGVGELSITQVANNEIEALVALDRLDDAERTIAFVEDKGALAGRAWHAAVAARGRALVAAARGDFDTARQHLGRAFDEHGRLPQPFELGRTLLAQGTIERRAKRRAEARQALIKALEVFDTLGAARWAEKAAAELARIPGRASSSGALTETERRVAELVAIGLSNKEVAVRLFITVRTVEANLSKIYAKLGVRSRTELTRHVAQDGRP